MRIPLIKLHDDGDSFINLSDIRYMYKGEYDKNPALHVKFKNEDIERAFLYTDYCAALLLHDDIQRIEELLSHFNKVYINAEGMPFAPGGVNE